jgi:hypothetical protein
MKVEDLDYGAYTIKIKATDASGFGLTTTFDAVVIINKNFL